MEDFRSVHYSCQEPCFSRRSRGRAAGIHVFALMSAAQSPPPLLRIWEARDKLASLDPTSDKLPSAREKLAEAVQELLTQVASNDVPELERRALDSALSPHAADLKGALLKALRLCSCARGFIGLPALMEETRKLLCAAPAKGVATYLEEALCKDIDSCADDARALAAVRDLMAVMTGNSLETGKPRLKKELGGHDLPAPHKKSCRTASNRASRALEVLEIAARKEQLRLANQAQGSTSRVYEMERDVRLDDAEDEARRASARSVGLDAVFAKGAAAAVAPPPTAIEMPEGSLREMRLEDEGRVAAQAAGVEALVDQALQSGRGGARSGKTKKAGNEASSASRSAGAAPGCSGSSAVHAGPPELS
jgi:hypothetical protein